MRPEAADPIDVLRWTFERFRRPVLVASFQIESCVLIDMAAGLRSGLVVLTLDTGRLPEETYTVMEEVRRRYPVELRILHPEPARLQAMTAEVGPNLFRASPELRRRCCQVRKAEPLAGGLRGHDAWITGLRRDQAATRAGTPVVGADDLHGGIAKIAPLAGWSSRQVWDYARARGVPVHPLYGRGYGSIGCAPCTRAVRPGEDPRAGRWWWETAQVKECGLHRPAGPPAGAAAAEELPGLRRDR